MQEAREYPVIQTYEDYSDLLPIHDEVCSGRAWLIPRLRNNQTVKRGKRKFEQDVEYFLGVQLKKFLIDSGLLPKKSKKIIKTPNCLISEFIRVGGAQFIIQTMQPLEQVKEERYSQVMTHLKSGWINYHLQCKNAHNCLGSYMAERIRQAAYYILIEQDARKAVEAIYGLLQPGLTEIGPEIRNSIAKLKQEIRQLYPKMAEQLQQLEHWIELDEPILEKQLRRRIQNNRP